MKSQFHPRLSATVSPQGRDLFVEICWEIGTLGLQEEETPAGIAFEAFFEAGAPLPELRGRFEEMAARFGLLTTAIDWGVQEDQADQWIEAYRESFTGFDVGARFHIHPSWEPPSTTHAVNILIEPGHAFGTGTHESTQLGLLALESAPSLRGRLLDVGTGSGILAIAASKLSPETAVYAMDNDPLAVGMAKVNLQRNQISTRGLFAGELTAVAGRFDWIVANLTMEIIRHVAPEIIRLAAGRVLLSGFTTDQAPIVADFFHSGEGFEVISAPVLNGWQCLLLRSLRRGP